ncbi:efflux RND transporter periplasmic adaptor subunit [Micromonospora sp. CA-263727]|uniref:efflux RND transporter periplasmic adaptor subunit n=1 Tax=Micromonospora sp. CA-263727 TaxID=3239967 RepID=UPI003D8A87C4
MGVGLKALRRLGAGRRGWWVVSGIAVAALLGSSGYAFTRTAESPAAATATATADRGEVSVAVATTGTLRPAQSRSLSFSTSGTIVEVKVRPGDDVRSGELLAAIDDADAQDRVESAEAALDKAEEALATATSGQSGSTCLTAGSVAAGQVRLVTLDPTSSPTPDASTASPTATPTPDSSTTPTPTPGASSLPPTAVPTPGRSGSSAQPGPAASSGGSCTSRGGQSGGGSDPVLRAQQQVNNAQASLAEAKTALTGARITAPIAGKVLAVTGTVGTKVSGGSTVITLADVAGMEVSARFPEADAGRLVTGLSATVTLADRTGEEFAATVTQVDPVGTASGQMVTYGVSISFAEVPTGALVGQSASVRVTVASVPDGLRVPSTAVRAVDAATGTVLLRTATGDESRQVTLGLRGDQHTEIRSGLAEGDVVVAAG